jgi:hypothetical protein
VKVGTKAWDIFEACLNRHLAPDEELDTKDLIGKRFEAMVVTTAFVITIEPACSTRDAKKRPLAPGPRPHPVQCF